MKASTIFWRYFSAASLSSVGTGTTTVVLPLLAIYVFRATPWEVTLITAASYASWLFLGLWAGVLVSRVPLRRAQVGLDVVRAVLVGSVPVLYWLGLLRLPYLVVVAFGVGLATVLFDVANSSFLPLLIPEEELLGRNSLLSGTLSVTESGGPALGGLLFQAVGAVSGFVLDAFTFMGSAVLLGSLPEVARAEAAGPQTPARKLIGQGWQFVRRHAVIFPCMCEAAAVNAVEGGLLALSPYYVARVLDAQPALVGLVLTSLVIGAALGAAVSPKIASWMGTARANLVCSVLAALAVFLLPLATPGAGVLVFAGGLALFGFGGAVGSVLTRTYRQTASPRELLPRVMATVRFVSWGTIPVGALFAGALASVSSTRVALLGLGAVGLVGPALLARRPLGRARDFADLAVLTSV